MPWTRDQGRDHPPLGRQQQVDWTEVTPKNLGPVSVEVGILGRKSTRVIALIFEQVLRSRIARSQKGRSLWQGAI